MLATSDLRDNILELYPISDALQCAYDNLYSSVMYGPYYTDILSQKAFLEFFALGGSSYIEEHVKDWCDTNQLNDNHTDVGSSALWDIFQEYVESLPSELYYETDSAYITEYEPEGEYISAEESDTGEEEYIEPFDYSVLGRDDIIRVIFGKCGCSNLWREYGM